MLERFHQFGITRQRVSSLDVARTVHLDQNRVVTLHYEGVFFRAVDMRFLSA
jgi:hypothetical protein